MTPFFFLSLRDRHTMTLMIPTAVCFFELHRPVLNRSTHEMT